MTVIVVDFVARTVPSLSNAKKSEMPLHLRIGDVIEAHAAFPAAAALHPSVAAQLAIVFSGTPSVADDNGSLRWQTTRTAEAKSGRPTHGTPGGAGLTSPLLS
jgi:hypothetical protein